MRAIVLDYERIGAELWSRFKPDSDQLWYYRSLSELFASSRPGAHADELNRLVHALEALMSERGDSRL